MINKPNWNETEQHFRELWANENEIPIMILKAVKEKGKKKYASMPRDVIDICSETEYVLQKSREDMENSIFMGDSFPVINPNLGPDIFGATLGADLIFNSSTSYSVPFVKDWTEKIEFKEDNYWWLRIKKMTEDIVEDSKGDYIVGITDLHFGADGLVSIRGPENLCMDIYDNPDVFKLTQSVLFPAFIKQFETLYKITTKYIPGSTSWFNVYHPGKWYVTSCDFIYMLSTKQVEEFIMPELEKEFEYFDGNTIFHLDGVQSFKHLDLLLEQPKLGGIQLVPGAGKPTASHWIPEIQKIQAKGKKVDISLHPQDIDLIFESVKPQGLSLKFNFELDEYDAREIIKKAERSFLKKR